MSTISWKIVNLTYLTQLGPHSDVVVSASWQCVASQDGASMPVGGSSSFRLPADSFTPYQDLTEEQVLQWVFNDMGASAVTQVESQATEGLQRQQSAQPTTPPLPWLKRAA